MFDVLNLLLGIESAANVFLNGERNGTGFISVGEELIIVGRRIL